MEIPSPKPYPVVGHLPYLSIDGKNPIQSMQHLLESEEFGWSCLKLSIAGSVTVATALPEHAQTVVEDTENFGKIVHNAKRGPFWAARQTVGKGLFTSSDTEEEWGLAHRVLIPAFSMHGMRDVVPLTVSAVHDTIAAIEALGPNKPFEAGGYMTGITFDVIGRFSASMNFGSSRDPHLRESHPFLQAMDTALYSNVILAQAPYKAKIPSAMMRSRKIAVRQMHEYVQKIIDDRKSGKNVPEKPDLLSRMLEQRDPVTEKKMSDELIRNNLITFFIAGHDSTSSLLTTALFYISQHPEVEERMVSEINDVLPGDDSVLEYTDLKKLKYMLQVLKECLRLHPPAGGFTKMALKDCKLGSYKIRAGDQVAVVLRSLQSHPAVWGLKAKEFNPDNFSPEAEATRHRYSWMPFSAGARACIGMQLSLTESRVALAILLKKYTFRLSSHARVYGDFSKLFFKMREVYITAHPRASTSSVPQTIAAPILSAPADSPLEPITAIGDVPSHSTPLPIFYGSNMGNCKGLAEKMSATATLNGFSASLAPLDDAVTQLPKIAAAKGFALIVTSTYNGTPPDNARAFSKWAETQAGGALSGIRFAVLGLGNSNWKTFQAFPRKVVADLQSAGGEQLKPLNAEIDEEDDVEAALAEWGSIFWAAVLTASGQAVSSAVPAMAATPAAFKVKVEDCPGGKMVWTDPAHEAARAGTVLRSYELTEAGSDRATKHVEIQLPRGVTYSHGDHLAVLPWNSFESVLRVAQALGVLLSDLVMVVADGPKLANLPYEIPVSVRILLMRHVDLAAPLKPALLEAAAKSASDAGEASAIRAMAENREVDMRLLQLLEAFPSIKLSLADVLPLLPPMKQRYYSISSSPKGPLGPNVASVTVGLVEGQSPVDGSYYQGMASGLLHAFKPGMPVDVFVARNDNFRLPANPAAPVIMIGPGTGLAPFRGFIQELAASERSGPAALFFGCRSEAEFLYKTELQAAAMDGTLEILSVAFSRLGPQKVYVQHELWDHRSMVWDMLQAGGYVYVCGDARHMAKDVDQTLVRIAQEVGGQNYEQALSFVQELASSKRYLQDVWAN